MVARIAVTDLSIIGLGKPTATPYSAMRGLVRIWSAMKARAAPILIEFALRSVLCAEVPVHIDGTQSGLEIAVHDGFDIGYNIASEAFGYITTSLFTCVTDTFREAGTVVHSRLRNRLLASAKVFSCHPMMRIWDGHEARLLTGVATALQILIELFHVPTCCSGGACIRCSHQQRKSE
jgi:hypothetical protein